MLWPASMVRAAAGAAVALSVALASGAAWAEIPYQVTFSKIESGDLANLLREVSELESLRDRPPPSLIALRRRADSDMERLRQVLRSEGYYEGTLSYEIGEAAPGFLEGAIGRFESGEDDEEPVSTPRTEVRISVQPGKRYQIGTVRVVAAEPAQAKIVADIGSRAHGLKEGGRARAERFVAAQRRILDWLARRGYPLAVMQEPNFIVDHATRTLSADFTVDVGPVARFGPTTIDGTETVDEAVIERRLAWSENELFDRRKIRETREALNATGLFASITIAHADKPGPDGTLPMRILVEEDQLRSIGAGAEFSTSEGFGGKVFWEHRNLLGEGERFRIEGVAAEITQSAEATLRIPDFFRGDQTLALTATAERERPDAFDADRIGGSAVVERQFGDIYAASAGVSLEWAQIEEDIDRDELFLFGLPVVLRRDSSDDLLNPTEGGRLQVSATPYVDFLLPERQFLVLRGSNTFYAALDDERRYLFSARGILGSILGESREDVPVDKRFFAGGGDTIRGYAFQAVGPLDSDDDPIGGRSIVAGSIEFRARLFGNFGAVAFLDGGNVYRDITPDLTEEFRFGTGVGVRYFTPVGPLRVDVAFPLNRRDPDDAFQFYISLGQAF